MPSRGRPLAISEQQALWFRARRGHLAGPGARSAREAARALIGAQSQQLAPSLLALSLRSARRPTATRLESRRLGASPDLVRTWGQRDTLFVYDPRDWPLVVAARVGWQPGARGGPLPTVAMLDRALRAIERFDRPVTRTDLIDVAPPRFVAALAERATAAGLDPARLAAARLIWRLSQLGRLCVVEKIGAEQAYALRSHRFPTLGWSDPDPEHAACELARRYLASFGPATVQDLAHFFNARVGTARGWLDRLGDRLIDIDCGDRPGLVALAADRSALRRTPPPTTSGWPARMLPLWDSLLMAHADKSWTAPDPVDRPRVWRKAAYVAAVVLSRGRIVAVWTHRATRRRLKIEVVPLSGWRRTTHLPDVRHDARAIADHLELDEVDVTVS